MPFLLIKVTTLWFSRQKRKHLMFHFAQKNFNVWISCWRFPRKPLSKCRNFTGILWCLIPKVPFTPPFFTELTKISSHTCLVYHITCRYKLNTFFQNAEFRLTKDFVTQVKNCFPTKLTFYSEQVSRWSFFFFLRWRIQLPCVEAFPVVLVITGRLKAWTVFSSCNDEASISTKQVSRFDKKTLFFTLFLSKIKTSLLVRGSFLTQILSIYSMIDIFMSFSS